MSKKMFIKNGDKIEVWRLMTSYSDEDIELSLANNARHTERTIQEMEDAKRDRDAIGYPDAEKDGEVGHLQSVLDSYERQKTFLNELKAEKIKKDKEK